MPLPNIQNRDVGRVVLSGVYLADVSTESSAFVSSPVRGQIVEAGSIIHNAVTNGDATITVKVNGNAVNGLSWTIANSGSAAGDVDSATCSPLTKTGTVIPGDSIEFASNGGCDTTCPTDFHVVIKRS
jgi:hypothetical protein